MKNRVFVFSELYFPDESATGYVLSKIAEGLARFYSVHVLCATPNRDSGRGGKGSIEQRNGVTIERCAATNFNKHVLLLRFLNLLTVSISIFWKSLWRLSRGDLVLVVTNPPSLPFFALAACRFRGAKCILLVHDVYPDVLTVTRILRPDASLTKFLVLLNKSLYRSVDKIIVLGRDMHELVCRKLGEQGDRVALVTNWADIDEIVPMARSENRFLGKLNLMGKFVVQYSGNMGRTHGLEALLDAARMLQGIVDIHFLLIGSGAKREWVETKARDLKLTNVTLLPPQPRHQLCEVLNACDLGIISFIPGMAGVSVPSRMYNVLAASKPIIAVADSESELARVVQEENVGWVVPPNRSDEVAAIIREAYHDPERLIHMGARARVAAETKYSFERVMNSYHTLFKQL